MALAHEVQDHVRLLAEVLGRILRDDGGVRTLEGGTRRWRVVTPAMSHQRITLSRQFMQRSETGVIPSLGAWDYEHGHVANAGRGQPVKDCAAAAERGGLHIVQRPDAAHAYTRSGSAA